MLAAAAFVALTPATAHAREELCDSSYQDCRQPLLALIQAETTEIDVGLWYMEDARYSNLIVQKWQAGVQVRILMDPREFPQSASDQSIMNQLQSAGIPMRKRIASGIEHWKAMIFASQNTVYFGSANFSPYEFVAVQPYVNYSDETVYFTDDASVVGSFMTKFDDAWVDTTNYAAYANVPPTLVRHYSTYPIDPELNFVPDQDYATRAVAQYKAETQKIDVDMFRITDQRHTNAIIAAVTRGVAVRLMVDPGEYRNPDRLWDAWNVDRLYMAGIPIRISVHQGQNHGKLVLLYGLGESIFGSSNWSSPSGDTQHEHNYFTPNPTLFNWFVTYFERRWNNSNPSGVQETGPFTPLPPDTPAYTTPADNAASVATSGAQLVWDGGPWAHNYDIYFGTSATPPLYAANLNLGPDDPTKTPKQYQRFSLPTLAPGTTYYWQIVSKTMANISKAGPIWSFTTAGSGGASTSLPAPWIDSDVGSTGIAGTASYDNGAFSVSGSGADVWGTADAFHFAYQSLSGDGQLVARITSVANVNAWSKAGVMIRETLSPGSAFAQMLVSAAHGTAFQYRTAAGTSAAQSGAGSGSAPLWIKIVRSGATISGYQSADGSAWTAIATATISMADTVYIGLAVVSHDNTQLCTAIFDNVTTTGGTGAAPPAPPASPTPGAGATGVSTRPTLTWTSAGATTYDVRFGTANPPPAAATGQSAASYTPSSLAGSTTYFWQIVAHNSSGATTGPVWSFTTAAGVPAPWQDLDIGAVGLAGSASYTNGTFTIAGSGADIWNTADAFHFVYQPLTGDGQLVARVATVQEASTWSKAGVMIRDTLDASSAYALMLVSAAKGTAFQYRTSAGASAAGVTGTTAKAPLWVKIVRAGSTVSGYQSTDGAAWQPIGSATIALGSTVQIGLAVTAHTNTQLCTASIDNVSQ